MSVDVGFYYLSIFSLSLFLFLLLSFSSCSACSQILRANRQLVSVECVPVDACVFVMSSCLYEGVLAPTARLALIPTLLILCHPQLRGGVWTWFGKDPLARVLHDSKWLPMVWYAVKPRSNVHDCCCFIWVRRKLPDVWFAEPLVQPVEEAMWW